jgi:hypothetical protein
MSDERAAWVAGAGTGLAVAGGTVHVVDALSQPWTPEPWMHAIGLVGALAAIAGVAMLARGHEPFALPFLGVGGVALVGVGAIAAGLLVLAGSTLVYGAGQAAAPTAFEAEDRSTPPTGSADPP